METADCFVGWRICQGTCRQNEGTSSKLLFVCFSLIKLNCSSNIGCGAQSHCADRLSSGGALCLVESSKQNRPRILSLGGLLVAEVLPCLLGGDYPEKCRCVLRRCWWKPGARIPRSAHSWRHRKDVSCSFYISINLTTFSSLGFLSYCREPRLAVEEVEKKLKGYAKASKEGEN